MAKYIKLIEDQAAMQRIHELYQAKVLWVDIAAEMRRGLSTVIRAYSEWHIQEFGCCKPDRKLWKGRPPGVANKKSAEDERVCRDWLDRHTRSKTEERRYRLPNGKIIRVVRPVSGLTEAR